MVQRLFRQAAELQERALSATPRDDTGEHRNAGLMLLCLWEEADSPRCAEMALAWLKQDDLPWHLVRAINRISQDARDRYQQVSTLSARRRAVRRRRQKGQRRG